MVWCGVETLKRGALGRSDSETGTSSKERASHQRKGPQVGETTEPWILGSSTGSGGRGGRGSWTLGLQLTLPNDEATNSLSPPESKNFIQFNSIKNFIDLMKHAWTGD